MTNDPTFNDDVLDAQGHRDAIGVAMQAQKIFFHDTDDESDASGFVALTRALLEEFKNGDEGERKFQYFCLGFASFLESAHIALGYDEPQMQRDVLLGLLNASESVPPAE